MTLNFRPNLDKIVELLLYLAHKRPDADKYQAVKFFYLADREHLSRYGRPITYETYFALPYGPVASNAMDLLEGDDWTMKAAGIEELPFDVEDTQKNGRPITYIRKPLRAVNLDLFSKSDLKVFDEILAKYGNADFDELYKITHKHFAYTRAWNSREKGYKRAEMLYEDMIEDEEKKKVILEDIGPVAAYME